MQKILSSLILCLSLLHAYPQKKQGSAAQGHQSAQPAGNPVHTAGYRIKITMKPYHDSKIYLGYYYGKIKALADSANLDGSGTGFFTGKTALPGGIYFVVSPRREILFEVLLDRQQEFSIVADTAGLPNNVVFTGSSDNTLFQSYSRFTGKTGGEITASQHLLASASNRSDSAVLLEKIKRLNADIQQYRQNIIAKYPSSLLATLFHALKEPVVPPAPAGEKGRPDSLFAYHYFKAHYWDSISLTDDRLLRTPIFEPRLDKYFRDLVPPEPDSIEREADLMLLFSRTNPEMFKFLLVYFVQKYINPDYMGQDAIFVHLFEKYINTGQAPFFTDKYRKFVNDRAYSLMANLIGQPAADLPMVDSAGKPRTLYGIDAPFVVLCFWDPTCSHCKEIVPKVDSIFQAKWKQEGVKVYGVMVDGGHDAWLKFISDHNLKDWIHVYQTKEQEEEDTKAGRPGYKQLYDVYQTPLLYLLDKDKRIIAKKLSYQQIDEVIKLKLQHAKQN
ncbi:MAG: thioredoxin-like domain-containing protein [Puia sp.]|nr:thioredoxin-like domain-containing protein [Puia sp.]